MTSTVRHNVLQNVVFWPVKRPSRGFSWKLWWFCGSSVLQGWADSSEQRGAAVVWDRPCWRFKSAERATKGRHVQVQPQSAFHLMEMSCSAGTKRGTLHFVINAANCVSTFPARGQLRAVSLCVNRPQKFTSLSLEGRRCDGQQLAGWQINKAAL